MASIVLFLAVLCAGASIIFSSTGMAIFGYPDWISNTCSGLPLLCNNSQHMGIAAAAFGALWLVMKLAEAIRD